MENAVSQEAIKTAVSRLQAAMQEPEKAMLLIDLSGEIRPFVREACKVAGIDFGEGEQAGILAGFLVSLGSDD
jgi:hypothetical protein